MAYTAFDRFLALQRFRVALPYIREGARVCDVGCGLHAAFLRYAGSRISFGVGLDYQPVRCVRRADIVLVCCNIDFGIPLRSAQFDHVVMLAVLEHLSNPRPLLEEIFRILTPNGSLIMTWPGSLVDPMLGVLHAIGMVSDEMESDKHESRVPVLALVSILKELGFSDFKHQRFELGLNNLLVCQKRWPGNFTDHERL